MKLDFDLSNLAFDFIESTRQHGYTDSERIDLVNFITNSSELYQKLQDRVEDFGNAKTYDVKVGQFENRDLNNFVQLQKRRQSTRNFGKDAIEYTALINLLQSSYFFSEKAEGYTSANIPSPGGLNTSEFYLLNLRVTEIPTGLYHYSPTSNKLSLLKDMEGLDVDIIRQEAFYSKNRHDIQFSNASVVIIIGTLFNRSTFKYGNKGVAFSYLEAGFLIQNIYLACAALDIACCANGGYYDDVLEDLIRYSSPSQGIVATLVIGTKMK